MCADEEKKKKKPEQTMYVMAWNTWRAACSYFIIIIRMCKGISAFFVSFRNSTVRKSKQWRTDGGRENNLATVENPTKDDSDLFK